MWFKKKPDKRQSMLKVIDSASTKIHERCGYGENLQVLTKSEKTLYITQTAECEVSNGGFMQLFSNYRGIYVNELVEAFGEIKAFSAAEICKKVNQLIARCCGTENPFIDYNLWEQIDESTEKSLEKFDDEFNDIAEDLISLNYDYVISNNLQY